MSKTIRLKESDIYQMVKRVLNEQSNENGDTIMKCVMDLMIDKQWNFDVCHRANKNKSKEDINTCVEYIKKNLENDEESLTAFNNCIE